MITTNMTSLSDCGIGLISLQISYKMQQMEKKF
jgi:hypothetical protein